MKILINILLVKYSGALVVYKYRCIILGIFRQGVIYKNLLLVDYSIILMQMKKIWNSDSFLEENYEIFISHVLRITCDADRQNFSSPLFSEIFFYFSRKFLKEGDIFVFPLPMITSIPWQEGGRSDGNTHAARRPEEKLNCRLKMQ